MRVNITVTVDDDDVANAVASEITSTFDNMGFRTTSTVADKSWTWEEHDSALRQMYSTRETLSIYVDSESQKGEKSTDESRKTDV